MEKLAEGVYLSGRYLGEEDPNASFILHHQGQCVIVESPPDKEWVSKTRQALEELGQPTVLFISETHEHWDHRNKRRTEFTWTVPLPTVCGDHLFGIGGEPLWIVTCPKHSLTDRVFIFRGTALTGDWELGQLESPNEEVPVETKLQSLEFLAGFEERHSYKIHTLISSHLNDLRFEIPNWRDIVLPTG